jgi:uncharacterized protein
MVSRRLDVPDTNDLDDREIEKLQALLDAVPKPLQPLDISALDGFMCGVLLQPNVIEVPRWLSCIADIDGRASPSDFDTGALHELARRRFMQLGTAIEARQWFDPWVFELETRASPSEAVLPWIAGFAAALDRFPELLQIDDPRLLEPLALIYMHFDPADLEDAEALQEVIDTLEPPADLAEAVQDLVRSVMLIADVVRPGAARPHRSRQPRPPGKGRRR